jgi:hypothetical protein
MPAHPESTWSSNGAGRGNVFVDADPDLDGIDSVTTPTTTSIEARRGRGLVVPIEEPAASPAHRPLARDAARFTRARPGTVSAAQRLRDYALAGDRAAKWVFAPLMAKCYRALIAVAATVALILAVGWLGVSLHSTTVEAAHARREQQPTATRLRAARAQIRVVIAQRTRAIGAARAARREQAAAAAGARRWRAQAAEARRGLAHARKVNRRHRSRG